MFQALWECETCGKVWGADPRDQFTQCPECGSEQIEQSDQPAAIN